MVFCPSAGDQVNAKISGWSTVLFITFTKKYYNQMWRKNKFGPQAKMERMNFTAS